MRIAAFARRLRHDRQQLAGLVKSCPEPAWIPKLEIALEQLVELEEDVATELHGTTERRA